MDLAQIGFRAQTSDLDKADKKLKKLAKTGETSEKAINKSTGSLTKSFGALAAGVGTVVAAFASLNKITTVSRQFDVLNAQLITATGSAENAAIAFGAIQSFAATTPYDLAQATKAFTQLVNLGLTPSEQALESYGNTASAMGKDLSQMVEAVADATTGEFERLKEFGIKAKSEGDNVSLTFQGVTKTIKKNAVEIEQYLMDIGNVQFAGAMAERAKTLDGAISNLGDTWDTLFLNISQHGIGNLMADGVRTATSSIDEFSNYIASGALVGNIQALGGLFDGFVVDIANAFNASGAIINNSLGGWWDDVVEFVGTFGEAFRRLPEMVRFGIQSATVYIANIVEAGKIHGDAFLEVMSLRFQRLVDRARIDGAAIAAFMNPFSDEYDYEAEMEALDAGYAAQEKSIIAHASRRVEILNEVRDQVVTGFAIEGAASNELYLQRVAENEALLEAYEADKAAKDEAVLGQFKIKTAVSETAEETKKATEKQANSLDSLTDRVDSFGGAWSRTGSIIVDAMGDITASMLDYTSRIKDIEKLEGSLAKEREIHGEDNAKIINMQKQLDSERLSAELSGMRAVADASGSLFDEKSAAAKTFAAMSKAIAVAEIALSFQKIAAGTAETTAHVANEGVKQTANSTTAITAAFGAPWPIGFAAGAAMIAIMASILGGGGGGGGGGASGGTALGGGDSRSISNATENLENIMIDQLAELRGLRGDLSEVVSESSNLLKELWSVDTGHHEIKNATEDMLEDSFEQLNLDKIGGDLGDDAPFADSLRSIFGAVENTIYSSLDSLGLTTNASLNDFIFRVGHISFDNLDSDAAAERLDVILSSQSDKMVEHLIPVITQFQQMGEGAFETLVRVAKEQAIFNDALDVMGLSLGSLSSVAQIEASQALIALTGGIENFAELTQSFSDEFLTEAEQMANLKDSLTDVFDQLGLGLSGSREEFKNLVAGVDITTDSGKELLAALLEINPAMAEYLDYLEEIESERTDMTIELLELQGKAEEALALSREQELAAMDESLRALQESIYAEEDRISALEEEEAALDAATQAAEQFASKMERFFNNFASDELKDATITNDLTNALKEVGLLVPETAQGFWDLMQSLDGSTEAGKAQIDAILGIQDTAKDYYDLLEEKAAAALEAEEEAAQALLDAIAEKEAAEMAAIDAAAQAAEQLASKMESFFNNFASDELKDATITDSLTSALKEVGLLVPETAQGFWDLMQSLDGATEAGRAQIDAILGIQDTAKDYYNLLEEKAAAALEAEEAAAQAILDAIAEKEAAEMEAAQALLDALTAAQDAGRDALDALSDSIALEKERASTILAAASDALALEKSRISALRDALNEEKALLDSNLSSSKDALNASFDAEQSRLDNVIANLEAEKSAVSQSFADRMSAISDSISSLISLTDNLDSAVGSVFAKSVDVDAALSAARGGNFSLAENLDLGNAFKSSGSFGSASEFAFSQAVTANKLSEISGLAGKQITAEERMLSAVEGQEATALAALDAQITEAQEQKTALQEQLNGILGIDTTVLSLEEAIEQYNAAQLALDELNYESEIEKLDMMLESAEEVYALHEDAYNNEIERLDNIYDINKEALNAALEINTNTLSVVDAVNELKESINAINAKTEAQQADSEQDAATQAAIAKALTEQTFLLRQIEDNGAQAIGN